MKKTELREYAKLIVRSGLNVQKGQEMLIYADLDQPEFVQMVVEEAYKAKAKEVIVNWSYQPLKKVHTRYQSVKTMAEVKEWEKARQQHYCDALPCRLHLVSEDPDGLKGVNMDKVAKAQKLSYPILKPYIDDRDGKQQWCIAAVPGIAWAKKVFPGVRASVAVEKLWESILAASRVTEDPIKAWEYYVRGSGFMHASCFEKMYDMLLTNEIQLGQMSNEEAMDLCMINGARLHNARLLVATVEAYKHGRLTRFAREIEMFHIPAYDAIPDDEPLDDEYEEPDDDGRFDAWA